MVEDFERFREFVVSTLQQRSEFQVTAASDGLDALQLVEEQQPDLVLLDIGLPDLNGMEVAKRLQRLAVRPNIVFISQESSPEVVGEALYLGALGYVNKLRTHSDLLPAIEAALEGRRFVSRGLRTDFGTNSHAQPRHEILFWSDTNALLSVLADFIAHALKSGNPALVRAPKSHADRVRQELQARSVDTDAAIERGMYAFLDVAERSDLARIPDKVARLSEAASEAGKKNPRVAVWSEHAGQLWTEGKTDEAIRLEQRANDLAKVHDMDILCPYQLPHGHEDHSAFQKICAEHSLVSLR